jgi:hypothetical protein
VQANDGGCSSYRQLVEPSMPRWPYSGHRSVDRRDVSATSPDRRQARRRLLRRTTSDCWKRPRELRLKINQPSGPLPHAKVTVPPTHQLGRAARSAKTARKAPRGATRGRGTTGGTIFSPDSGERLIYTLRNFMLIASLRPPRAVR